MARATVLHVIEHMHRGGRERALERLVRGMDGDRYHSIVATFLGGEIAEAMTADGFDLVRIDARPDVARIGALARLIRERGVDLVHSHMFSGGAWGRAAALKAGVRGVLHTHATLSFREHPWKTYVPELLLTGVTDKVICVSQAVYEHLAFFLRPFRSRLVVISNGLDVDPGGAPPRRDRSGPPLIVGVGRFEPVKGFDVMLRALAELARRGVDFRCSMVGDGGERAALEALSRSLGLEKQVAFVGYRSDVTALLADADLFVAPSHREGLSNAVLEAMAAALPIVATRVGGNPQLLDSIGGLVPPADPPAMADEIQRLFADPRLARERGEKGHAKIVSEYTLASVVRRHEELYDELLARRPASVMAGAT